MKKYKFFAAAAMFVILTAVKLAAPAPAENVRREVASVIMRDDDYVKTVQTWGEKLKMLGSAQASAVPAEASASPEPQSVQPSAPEPSPTVSPEPADAAAPREQASAAVPDVVSAFIESQKAYPDYAIPADVVCDKPALPFKFASPVKGVTSSGFGYREHPIKNEIKFHYGTDFAAQSGDNIYAFADGTVEKAQEDDSFGKYIVIDHGGGYRTLYAHCGKLYVSAGEKVKLGQKIALVGQTGSATGPHLHFELTSAGKYLDPEFYV